MVRQNAAPYFVRWVRRFLSREATSEALVDQVRRFCDDRERAGESADWQIRQAEQALRLYFVDCLDRTDWSRQPATTVVDEHGGTSPLAALEEMRRRLRTRHYAYRTECTYVDWVRRFLAHVGEQQGARQPRVDAASVRSYLTHLAIQQRVSASTQNQAFCAILFLCREVLGMNIDGVGDTTRARRGERLPVVMSVAETAARWRPCEARRASWRRSSTAAASACRNAAN